MTPVGKFGTASFLFLCGTEALENHSKKEFLLGELNLSRFNEISNKKRKKEKERVKILTYCRRWFPGNKGTRDYV